MEAALGAGDRESSAVGDVLARVPDVVEQRPLDVLGERRAQKLADHPVDGLRLETGDPLHGHAVDDREAAPRFEPRRNHRLRATRRLRRDPPERHRCRLRRLGCDGTERASARPGRNRALEVVYTMPRARRWSPPAMPADRCRSASKRRIDPQPCTSGRFGSNAGKRTFVSQPGYPVRTSISTAFGGFSARSDLGSVPISIRTSRPCASSAGRNPPRRSRFASRQRAPGRPVGCASVAC